MILRICGFAVNFFAKNHFPNHNTGPPREPIWALSQTVVSRPFDRRILCFTQVSVSLLRSPWDLFLLIPRVARQLASASWEKIGFLKKILRNETKNLKKTFLLLLLRKCCFPSSRGNSFVEKTWKTNRTKNWLRKRKLKNWCCTCRCVRISGFGLVICHQSVWIPSAVRSSCVWPMLTSFC
jgi:hypothetical protein